MSYESNFSGASELWSDAQSHLERNQKKPWAHFFSAALLCSRLVGAIRTNGANTLLHNVHIMPSMTPSNASLNKFKGSFMNTRMASPVTRPEHHWTFMGSWWSAESRADSLLHHCSDNWRHFFMTNGAIFDYKRLSSNVWQQTTRDWHVSASKGCPCSLLGPSFQHIFRCWCYICPLLCISFAMCPV